MLNLKYKTQVNNVFMETNFIYPFFLNAIKKCYELMRAK